MGYQQTATLRAYQLVRSAIRRGDLAVGERVSEEELVDDLGVSRTAARAALAMLSDEGIVERRPRVGTVVRRPPVAVASDRMHVGAVDPTETREAMTRRVSTRVVAATPIVESRISVPSGRMRVLSDLLHLDNEPIAIRTVYEDSDAVVPAANRELEALTVTFLEGFGRPLGRIETNLESVPSDSRASRLLGLPAGLPMLLREQVLFDVDGIPRLLSHVHYRGDRASFVALAVPDWSLPATPTPDLPEGAA